MVSNRVLWLVLTSPAVWLGTRMTLARAASTDGRATMTVPVPLAVANPEGPPSYVFIALRRANCLSAACKCFSTGVQPGATASQGSFKTWTSWVPPWRWRCGHWQDQDFRVRARRAKWPGRCGKRCWARAGCPIPAARWRCLAVQWFLYIIFVKESRSTDMFTLAA